MDTNTDAEPTLDVKQSADIDQPRIADHESVLKDDDLPDKNPEKAHRSQKDLMKFFMRGQCSQQDFEPRRLSWRRIMQTTMCSEPFTSKFI